MTTVASEGPASPSMTETTREPRSKCFFPTLSEAQPGPGKWLETIVDIEDLDLRSWCDTRSVHLGVLFGAAWAVVLSRYVGTEDVCFGFCDAAAAAAGEGKWRPSIVGVKVGEENSVEKLLLELGERNQDALHVGEDTLETFYNGEGVVGQERLCNTCVHFIDEDRDSEFRARAHSEVTHEQLKAINDVMLSVQASKKAVSVVIAYSSSIMSEKQAVHLASAMAQGVKSITTKDLQSPSRDIDLFHSRHRIQVQEWNKEVPQAVDACTHESICQQVLERPNAQAICSWDGDFTYAELSRLSDRLAQQLTSVGVGPEVLVPICFHKSRWAVVAMLGVMKAGGAFVPLSPFHPRKLLETIVQDVSASFVLADTDATELFDEIVDHVIVVPIVETPATRGDDFIPSKVNSANAAYVIYTSGSTGTPKGVVIEHRALSTNIKHLGAAFGFSCDSRVYQFSSYTFDVSILDVFVTLAAGGCVCIPSEDQRANNIEAMNRMKITLAILTPSVARTLDPASLATLGTLIFGGEAVGHSDVSQWAGRVRLINGYGPTECCIACVFNVYAGRGSRSDIIGRAVGSTPWVVEPDNHENLAPVGAVGELVVQGAILARGYLHNQKKTDQAFVFPKWLSKSTSTRVYKTGDLVRYTDDGSLIYLGRKDTQVKLHGQRIEVGEIEHHILGHPLIKNALVLLADIRNRVKGLVAVVVMQDNSNREAGSGLRLMDIEQASITTLVGQVRDYVSKCVPMHMVPTVWLAVEDIPSLSSAKADRNSVAHWLANIEGEVSAHNALRSKRVECHDSLSPMESKLQRIVARVLDLDLDKFSMSQSFSSIGGDSIAAMEITSRCRDEDMGLRFQDVMTSRSIIELLQTATPDSRVEVHVPEEEPDVPLPLSSTQRLYFDQPTLPTRFHSSVYLRFLENIDTSSMVSAIKEIVQRHSQLRARFVKTAEGWQQFINKDVTDSYSLQVHEIDDEAQIPSLVAATQKELDICKGPIFAADVFDVKSKGQKMLFCVAHHLIVDLVSWHIFLHDLEVLLRHAQLSCSAPFPFWKWSELQAEKCQDSTPSNVLPDRIPPANMDYWELHGQPNGFADAIEVHFELDTRQTALLLQHYSQVLNTEPVNAFLATALYSFGRIFQDRAPPTFYCENHGREAWDEGFELSGTVGWFNTLVPLSIGAQYPRSIEETVQRVRETREKIPHHGQPYFAYRCLHPEGREAFKEHSNMEVFFNYTGYRPLELGSTLLKNATLSGEGTEDIGSDTRRLALLDVLVDINGGCLQFTFLYSRHMKHQDKIRRWVEECQRCLMTAVSEKPDGYVAPQTVVPVAEPPVPIVSKPSSSPSPAADSPVNDPTKAG